MEKEDLAKRTMHPDVALLFQALQSHDDSLTALQSSVKELIDLNTEDRLEGVIAGALSRVISDSTITSAFWKSGYDAFVTHGSDGAARAVGRRLITLISTALVALGLWLAATSGRWK